MHARNDMEKKATVAQIVAVRSHWHGRPNIAASSSSSVLNKTAVRRLLRMFAISYLPRNVINL